MTKVGALNRANDMGLVGKLGQGFQYGERIYGKAHYGDEEVYNPASENGVKLNGDYFFGDMDNIWGVYQRRHNKGRTVFARLKFYNPKNPQTIPQQANRNKFSAGMLVWKNLTNEQKAVYNERAKKVRLHGVNLFLKEYLNSN